MTREEAIKELNRVFEPAYANYIVIALTDGATVSDTDTLDKIRAEIEDWQIDIHDNERDAEDHDFVFERIFEIIDEYRKVGEKE